jgi:hypothetical protein
MLINLLITSTIWFIISFAGVLLGGTRLRRGNLFLSTSWLLLVLSAGALVAIQIVGFFPELIGLTGLAILLGLFCFWRLRDWNAFGQVMLMTTVLLTFLFIGYLFSVTYVFSPPAASFFDRFFLLLCGDAGPPSIPGLYL